MERSLKIDSSNKTFFPFLLFGLFCLINGLKHEGFFEGIVLNSIHERMAF